MPARLSGTLFTLEDHFMYVGPLLRSAPHAHHAGQIMWVPDGIALQRGDEEPSRATFAVIRPDQVHAHEDASFAAVLWLDGDDVRWRLREPFAASASAELDELAPRDREPSPAAAQSLAARLLGTFAPQANTRSDAARHPAVQRMCALLDAGSTTPSHELRLTQLARRAGLSERQLREVFVRDTGLTPRAYLRWRRLRHAVASIREGASLTMAAMHAGFADGPHFSRVFHAQFGISPHSAFASMRFGDAPQSPERA
jgi:AraC-like DNA-binding protein